GTSDRDMSTRLSGWTGTVSALNRCRTELDGRLACGLGSLVGRHASARLQPRLPGRGLRLLLGALATGLRRALPDPGPRREHDERDAGRRAVPHVRRPPPQCHGVCGSDFGRWVSDERLGEYRLQPGPAMAAEMARC